MSELLHRAVRVLEVLRTSEDPLSIRQVAEKAGLSKSTVQRLLRELVATDLASQHRITQRYQLGPRTLALGAAYQKRLDVRQLSLAHMTRLRDATGETAGLSVGYGDQLMHIEQVPSGSQLRAIFDIGRPLPLWSGAPSRLLLADRAPEEIRRILAEHGHGDLEPVDPPSPDKLLADIETARESGYAMAIEETLPGVSTMSAAVRDSTGALVATLSLTMPSSRLTADTKQELLRHLLRAADAISAELGWVPRPRAH
ncbi:MAG: IclR family transcriptional regulator [Micromonosporaceae bacterium]